jgi:hypothetical protein
MRQCDRVMSKRSAAFHLDVPIEQINAWEREGLLPTPFYVGAQPFFVFGEIKAFRENREANERKERVNAT